MALVKQAESFRVAVKDTLERRARSGERTVAWLARAIGFRRETVSRAINRGEFPNVQSAIRAKLGLDS